MDITEKLVLGRIKTESYRLKSRAYYIGDVTSVIVCVKEGQFVSLPLKYLETYLHIDKIDKKLLTECI